MSTHIKVKPVNANCHCSHHHHHRRHHHRRHCCWSPDTVCCPALRRDVPRPTRGDHSRLRTPVFDQSKNLQPTYSYCVREQWRYNNTTTVLRPFVRTTRVSRYQKKHSPIHHPDHHPIFISFFHLLPSIASSLLKLRAWQSFCTTSVHVLYGLALGLEPSTSYSIHFFTQSVSFFSQHMPIPSQPVLL